MHEAESRSTVIRESMPFLASDAGRPRASYPEADSDDRGSHWWPVLAAVALTSCGGDYPIAPTACDDWCLATQRANCDEDDPLDCVRECEDDSLIGNYPACVNDWNKLKDCYQNASSANFVCEEGHSRPVPMLCSDELLRSSYCASKTIGLCAENCLRFASECGGTDQDCIDQCQSASVDCEQEQQAWYRCSLDAPVDCDEASHPDRLTPCLSPLEDLLVCAGLVPQDG